MDYAQVILLGILQGLTEFLPISSSGHLVLAGYFLGVEKTGIELEVFLHFGTLLSVLIIFKKDVAGILNSFFSKIYDLKNFNRNYRSDVNFRLSVLIIIGTIPAGVVGFLFEDKIETLFQSPKLTSVFLILTGLILFSTRFAKNDPDKEFNLSSSIFVGMAQALAILPGISRSGVTISTGMHLGINGEKSAKFSFLLALPAIFGATLLKIIEMIQSEQSGEKIFALVLGMFTAFISGYVAIKMLLHIISRGNFQNFAYYCILIGTTGLIFL